MDAGNLCRMPETRAQAVRGHPPGGERPPCSRGPRRRPGPLWVLRCIPGSSGTRGTMRSSCWGR